MLNKQLLLYNLAKKHKTVLEVVYTWATQF